MASTPIYATAMAKQVADKFVTEGWEVDKKPSIDFDFFVKSKNLTLLIKFLDKGIIKFKSPSRILDDIEKINRLLFSNVHRSRIIILEENFLAGATANLLDRNIFLVAQSELSQITGLTRFQNQIPENISPFEEAILKNDFEYAVSASVQYQAAKKHDQAILWAEQAIRARKSYSHAYPHLFHLLKASGNLDRAELVGRDILEMRPNDEAMLNQLISLAKMRGDQSSISNLERRLSDRTRNPQTLSDILKKQHNVSQIDQTASVLPIEVRAPGRTSAPGNLVARLRRFLG